MMVQKIVNKLVSMTMTQILLISLGIGAFYFHFYFDPGTKLDERIKTLEGELEAEERRRVETDRYLKEEKRMQEVVGSLGAQFEEILKKLPSELTPFAVDQQISVFSQMARVRVSSRIPQAVAKKEIVDEVPVRITINDVSFSEIAQFIYHVSTSERLFTIKNFSINPGGEKGNLRFEGTVTGYRSNQSDDKKAGKSGGGTK